MLTCSLEVNRRIIARGGFRFSTVFMTGDADDAGPGGVIVSSLGVLSSFNNDSMIQRPGFQHSSFKSFNVNSISKKFESLLKKPWSWAVPSSSPEDLNEPVVEGELVGENVIEQGIFKWYESINENMGGPASGIQYHHEVEECRLIFASRKTCP